MLHKNNVPLLAFFFLFFPFLLYQIHKKKKCVKFSDFTKHLYRWSALGTLNARLSRLLGTCTCIDPEHVRKTRLVPVWVFFEFFFELFSIGIRIEFSEAKLLVYLHIYSIVLDLGFVVDEKKTEESSSRVLLLYGYYLAGGFKGISILFSRYLLATIIRV